MGAEVLGTSCWASPGKHRGVMQITQSRYLELTWSCGTSSGSVK
jgi:hypothetical protein